MFLEPIDFYVEQSFILLSENQTCPFTTLDLKVNETSQEKQKRDEWKVQDNQTFKSDFEYFLLHHFWTVFYHKNQLVDKSKNDYHHDLWNYKPEVFLVCVNNKFIFEKFYFVYDL